MKKLFLTAILLGLAVMPVLATPTFEFSPGGASAGGWTYDGAGTIKFSQTVNIDRVLGSNSDALVGAWVYIPDLLVTGIPGGPYVLTPATPTISIKNSSGTVTYLTGTLGSSDLIPIGTTAMGYVNFQTDITNVIVNNTIGSNALAAITAMTNPAFDFELSFNSAPAKGFKWMLDNNIENIGGFSGAMTVMDIPEPATICLLALGSLALIRRKK